ncbi:hypothetical protein ACUXLG_005952 [Ralstonia sp. 121560039-2]
MKVGRASSERTGRSSAPEQERGKHSPENTGKAKWLEGPSCRHKVANDFVETRLILYLMLPIGKLPDSSGPGSCSSLPLDRWGGWEGSEPQEQKSRARCSVARPNTVKRKQTMQLACFALRHFRSSKGMEDHPDHLCSDRDPRNTGQSGPCANRLLLRFPSLHSIPGYEHKTYEHDNVNGKIASHRSLPVELASDASPAGIVLGRRDGSLLNPSSSRAYCRANWASFLSATWPTAGALRWSLLKPLAHLDLRHGTGVPGLAPRGRV